MARPAQEATQALHLAGVAHDDACDRVIARVRLRAAMRAAWLHHLWTLESADPETPLARIANDRDQPQAEATWRAGAAELAELRAACERIEGQLATDKESRLGHLVEVFGLDRAAVDILHLTLAHAIDDGLGPILRHLAGDGAVAYPTARLAARVFGDGRTAMWRSNSAIARWRIVGREDGDAAASRLVIDDAVRDWLVCGPLVDPRLAGVLRSGVLHEPLDHWPVEATAERIGRVLASDVRSPVRVSVFGVDGIGRQSFAAAVAHRLGLSLAVADVSSVGEARREDVAVRAHRHAFIARAALAWRGFGATPPRLPDDLVPFPVEFVLLLPHEPAAPKRDAADLRIALAPPDCDMRARLWRRYCPEAATWPQDELRALADRHRAPPGRIAAAAALRPRSAQEASAALSGLDSYRFGKLAERLPCPFGRDDLVLPPRLGDQLVTLMHEAKSRSTFWERPGAQRLFPNGRGLVALFTGPPGTGKTMAAQVIARELGLDLYRIDLSAIVSKYVGETAANIERVLSEAQATDVVLLFDEADGLFARRTDVSDAHDRYANTDTGHLLQAIERHDGIVLLASNRKRNIDEAFLRRLRYVLEFPLPDDAARLAIWRQVLCELAGPDRIATLEAQLARVASRLVLTGAQIKHAALTAIFHAERVGEPIDARHVLRGIDAELMKEGRALSEREIRQLEAGP